MKINRDNYEAYFLDYHEGNLNPDEMAAVLVFIGQNPDLKEEFDEFENVSLSVDDSVSFSEKDFLKKNVEIYSGPVTTENIEEYLVAETEGLLPDETLSQLNDFVNRNPGFRKDRRIYAHTRLAPAIEIVYGNKHLLKHVIPHENPVNEANCEEFMIRKVEGLLGDDEAGDLDDFLEQNPRFRKEMKFFGLTKLQPDTSVTYWEKASLKHTIVPVRRIVYYAMSAAASVALLMGVYFAWERNRPSDKLAEIKSAKTAVTPAVIPDLPSDAQHQDNVPDAEIPAVTTSASSGTTVYIAASQPVKVQNNDDRTAVPMLEPLAECRISSKNCIEPEFLFIRQSRFYGSRYIDLYNSVKLSEQIQYASLNAPDKNPVRTIWKGVFNHIEDKVIDDRRTKTEPAPELSIWTLAEASIKAYNNLTHDDLELLLQKDEKGEVVSYALIGDKVNIERDIAKK